MPLSTQPNQLWRSEMNSFSNPSFNVFGNSYNPSQYSIVGSFVSQTDDGSSPYRGNSCFRTEHYNLPYINNSGYRIMYAASGCDLGHPDEMEGQTYWFGWACYFDPDWTRSSYLNCRGNSSDNGGMILCQINGGPGGPCMQFRLDQTSGSSGRLSFQRHYMTSSGSQPTQTYGGHDWHHGEWHSYIMRLRASTVTNGFIQVWLDGNEFVNLNNIQTTHLIGEAAGRWNGTDNYWNWGMYWSNQAHDRSACHMPMYWDNMALAIGNDRYADVDPSQGGTTNPPNPSFPDPHITITGPSSSVEINSPVIFTITADDGTDTDPIPGGGGGGTGARVQIIDNTLYTSNGDLIRGAHGNYTNTSNLGSSAWWGAMRSIGLNTVRLDTRIGSTPSGCDDESLKNIATQVAPNVQLAVDMARQEGFYLILDHHSCCCPAPSISALTPIAEIFWQYFAALYKDEEHVIYEISNEPTSGGRFDATARAFEQDMYTYIRGQAPDTHIIAWSSTRPNVNTKPDIDLQDSSINYSNATVGVHPYQHLTNDPSFNYIDAIRGDYPMIITEFTEHTNTNVDQIWAHAESEQIAWIYLDLQNGGNLGGGYADPSDWQWWLDNRP